MENASLKDLLREHIELKGFTPKKIAEITGIPERYIDALLEGNEERLPPSPYVHGYITKLSGVLNFDKETMWRLYQKESLLRTSGEWDRLPKNRFAIPAIDTRWLIGGVIVLGIVLYIATNVYSILTPPPLTIIVPSSEYTSVAQPILLLQGKTDPSYTLTINGSEVYIDKDGNFQKEIQLQEGTNAVEFVAKKFLGKETRIVRHIVYSPPEALFNENQSTELIEQ